MARKKARGVVLLSIKPRFAHAIMRGEKKVEFRRRPWKSDVDTVVVYATEPEKQIIGYFTVSFVDLASPTELWRRHGSVGAIGREEYRSYYSGATSGVAVGIGAVRRLYEGRGLRSITPLERPPQSFAYLDRGVVSRLQPLRRSFTSLPPVARVAVSKQPIASKTRQR